MKQFLTLDDLNLKGKRVLVRCDFNVPLHDHKILDHTRIDRAAPTLLELMDKGAKVIVLSHMGRPTGHDSELSLNIVREALSDALYGANVTFVSDCVGPVAEKAVQDLEEGHILLLENLRFHPEEQKNDLHFAEQLAKMGDIYVNDAFSVSHRPDASISSLPKCMPVVAIGRLMQSELSALTIAFENPKRPVMAIVGGSKVSTKIQLLRSLIQKVDKLVLGGGMANTILLAQGYAVGKSLCEENMKELALDIIDFAHQNQCELLLPSDVIITSEVKNNPSYERELIENVPENGIIADIGPTTRRSIIAHLKECKTLLWNGPLGIFEISPFDEGTRDIALAVAERTRAGLLTSIAGGGDTIAALSKDGVLKDFTYVSTAGGAFLEWIEGQILPGIKALECAAPEGIHCPLKKGSLF